MSFPRVRSAGPRLSVAVKRPEVPEAVRSRVPQRRSRRPWRLYLVGALATLAVASVVTMVVKRRVGGAEEETDASVEGQPSMPTATSSSDEAMSPEAAMAEAVASEATAAEGTEEPASEEAQRFSA